MASLPAETYAQPMDGVVLAGVIAVSALLIGVAGLVLAVTITRRIGTRDPIAIPPFWRKALRIKELPEALQGDFAPTKRGTERIAFIANPTKPGMSELRERALRAASIRYLPQPMWLYTTEDDPGGEAAQEALEAGADVVVAVGGGRNRPRHRGGVGWHGCPARDSPNRHWQSLCPQSRIALG